MKPLHSLLGRQLKKLLGTADSIPPEWQGLVEVVDRAYRQFDADRSMLERSLELSSQELIEANLHLERIINSSVDGILAFDRDARYTVWNAGMERITGFTQREMLGKRAGRDFPFWGEAGGDEYLHKVLSGQTVIVKDRFYKIPQTGREGYFEGYFSALCNEPGEVIGGLAIIRDITERKQAEETLAIQATHDALTGLYNRRYFDSRIKEEIARAARNEKPLAVLLCDLDRFKAINDTLGHQFGDEVLKRVAEAVQGATRATDLAFRWGGDEIVVLFSGPNRDGILIAAERIRKSILRLRTDELPDLDVSIGVAIYPEHGTQPDTLLRMADRALYIAKKGGGKVHIGEEEYRLDDRAVRVVFQPINDVRLSRVLGYEALSRDPQGKQSILSLFKKYHAIGQLHELKCLCFQLQLKVAQEVRLERLFLNVDFKLLKSIDVPPKPSQTEVVLEISESEVLEDVEDHIRVARKWRAAGYKFAIDDFGAGFVSLPFISRLVPNYIKLDRSTVLQAVHSIQFKMILQDLISALRKTSTDGVIAEGVENEKELSVVQELGIHLIQGFLFGRPQELN